MTEAALLLTNNAKTELVSNLISHRGKELGFGEIFYSELFHFPQALRLILSEKKDTNGIKFKEVERKWNPYSLEVRHCSKKIDITEKKSVYNNTLANKLVITNKTNTKLTLRLIGYGLVTTAPQASTIASTFPLTVSKDGQSRLVFTARRNNIYLGVSPPPDKVHFKALSKEDLIRVKYFSSEIEQRYHLEINPKILKEALGELGSKKIMPRACTSEYILFSYVKRLTVAPFEKKSFVIGLGEMRKAAFDFVFQRAERQWDGFTRSIPAFRCSDKELEKLYYFDWYSLYSNRIRVSGISHLPYPFTSPNKFFYFHQWLWDSAFHAIIWNWYNDKALAIDEMKNLICNQWRNGMIPHEIFVIKKRGKSQWPEADGTTSYITQPPIIPVALWEIYKKTGDKAILRKFYTPLRRSLEWFLKYRDPDQDGLYSWTHVFESGADNSPRWDTTRRNRLLDPSIEAPDLTALIYLQCVILRKMARELGKKPDSSINVQMNKIKKNFNRFWDKKEEFFFDLIDDAHKMLSVKTYASFIPLLAGLVSKPKIEQLLTHLMDKNKFFTGCPIPTVSKDESTCNASDFWRGPTWPNINWIIIEGLCQSDKKKEAALILERFLRSVSRNDKLTCGEHFNSTTGKSIGMKQYGWGAINIDFILRRICGIVPEKGNKLNVAPLDIGLKNFEIDNLIYKGKKLRIIYDQKQGYELYIGQKRRLKLAGFPKRQELLIKMA